MRKKTFTLELKTHEIKSKIGKLNEKDFDLERCKIVKEHENMYKIYSKKHEISDYTGLYMADQTAKYLLFNINPARNTIELTPVSKWFNFKKDIKFKTKTTDEAEEELKKKSINHLAKKSSHKTTNKKEKSKKNDPNSTKTDKEIEEEKEEKVDSDEDDRKFFEQQSNKKSFKKNYNRGGDDEDDVFEFDDEPPSDYDEFMVTDDKKKEGIEKKIANDIDDSEASGSSEGEVDKIESEVDDGSSDEMEKDEMEDFSKLGSQNDFLQNKRKNEDVIIPNPKKGEKSLDEFLNRVFQKQQKIKYSEIEREVRNSVGEYNLSIESKVKEFLKNNCSKFQEGEYQYYYLK